MESDTFDYTTVRDFLDDGGLGLEVIVEGDLGGRVEWVHVTELPDPSSYIGGGELILSAGLWYDGTTETSRTFVESLSRSSVTALGWGLLADSFEVPDDVVLLCRKCGLTLVSVPIPTPFIAVGRWFSERVQRQREAGLLATIERGERFVRAISSLPGGLRGILDALVGTIGLPSRVEDAGGCVLSASPGLAPTPGGGCAEFPLSSPGEPGTVLVVELPDGSTLDRDRLSTIGQALPFLEFVISHESELREAESRLATELVEAVLARRNLFASGRLEAYGLDPTGEFIGAFVSAPPGGSSRAADLAQRARRLLPDLGGSAIAAVWKGEVVLIVQSRNLDADDLGPTLGELGSGISAGVGSPGTGVEGLRRSLVQARQALALAVRRGEGSAGRGGYVVHGRAESYTLLLALQDEEVLDSFRETVLGNVEEYDLRRGSTLLPTLRAFVSSGCRWQDTARGLHIHVNTLRSRIAKCEELTGRDLSSMDDLVDLYVALRSERR